jgi:hypothetical protein
MELFAHSLRLLDLVVTDKWPQKGVDGAELDKELEKHKDFFKE